MKSFFHKKYNEFKRYYIFFLVFVFYFIFNLDFIYSGQSLGDDFAFLYSLEIENFSEKIKRFIAYDFNTRPIASIYLGLISLYGKNTSLYIIQNLLIWFISILIISLKLQEEFNKKTGYIFFLLALFPSICSTIIFSPIIQSLGVVSIFLWSLSLKFEKNKFLSIFFIIIASLTYETALILVPINFYFWCKNQNINNFIITKYILNFILLILFIFFFQQSIAKLTNHSSTLKYFFQIKDGIIIIEENFFLNIQKYFFKPISLILWEIPILLLSSLKFFILNFENIFLLISLFVINFLAIFKTKNNFTNKNDFKFLFFIVLAIFLNFFLYLIATSVPQVNGYYNRGLVSLFILITLSLSFFFSMKFKDKYKLILNILIVVIIFLNFNSLNVQKNIYIQNSFERDNILKNFLKLSDKKINQNDRNIILAMVPTFNNINYNDEIIFSEETRDLEFFFKIKYSKNITVLRIFYDDSCLNILSVNKNSIISKQPPTSRKEINFSNIKIIDNITDENIYVYLFNKDFFRISKDNLINQKKLSDNIKCYIY